MIGRYHRIKLVIFDLDQTLLCTIRRFYEALNEALRIHGEQQLSWNEFVELYSHDMLRVRYTDDRLWHYFLTIYTKRRTSHDGPLEGAKEILEWLKKNNIKVAIVTGRIAEVSDVIRELEDYGLADHIDLVLTHPVDVPVGDLRASKRELIKRALERLGVQPKEALFVGDYVEDIVASKSLNVTTVGILTGLMNDKRLKELGADYVVRDLKELLQLLKDC